MILDSRKIRIVIIIFKNNYSIELMLDKNKSLQLQQLKIIISDFKIIVMYNPILMISLIIALYSTKATMIFQWMLNNYNLILNWMVETHLNSFQIKKKIPILKMNFKFQRNKSKISWIKSNWDLSKVFKMIKLTQNKV